MRQDSEIEPMPYIHTLPTSASFTGKGLLGYSFGPLSQQDLEIYYIEVEKGHDTFMVSRKIKRTYYVLAGSGYFTIENRKYDVRPRHARRGTCESRIFLFRKNDINRPLETALV